MLEGCTTLMSRLKVKQASKHTHTYTDTYMHTHTYIHTDAYWILHTKDMHSHKHSHTQAYPHTHTHIQAYSHCGFNTSTHIYTHENHTYKIQAHTHTHKQTTLGINKILVLLGCLWMDGCEEQQVWLLPPDRQLAWVVLTCSPSRNLPCCDASDGGGANTSTSAIPLVSTGEHANTLPGSSLVERRHDHDKTSCDWFLLVTVDWMYCD